MNVKSKIKFKKNAKMSCKINKEIKLNNYNKCIYKIKKFKENGMKKN